jgi:hypothetical protein
LIRVSLSGEQWPDMQTRKLQQKSPVLPEAYALPGETIETRSSSYVS